ncbi:16S rRNA pseudouridine(516) synthase [Pseudomonas sp. TMP25]|uniref:pseudouridine synthase n=1 Tax=Pseudomonas sp. TMP25 TaxID=3136561 RepID=UPI003100B50B
MRLDRFLSNLAQFNRQTARQLLASGHVQVDGVVVCEGLYNVSQFSRIEVDNQLLQAGKPARYFMLHKPIGVVSATEHDEHRTVLDLLDEPDKADLHLAGRLDLNTSGLLLLTNDGQWSRRLTEPRSRLGKVYRVTTEQPISAEYIEVFAQGLYFAYEGLTTLPAELVILDSHSALLTLHEGRYHQVKRMFGHFQNKVIDLHRLSMGSIELDPQLAPGQYRALNPAEIASC